ncbi:MAG: S41 family peptidase [Solirubrobacterales bacterium]|nr:S41 family peptidase [Solirubrobacterales bacterium]
MRTLITILAIFTALVGGIYIGANPNTPVVGVLKDVVAPDQAEIPADQVQTLIENEYYRKVADEKLTNGSISGMVKSLNDQFSHYFDPQQNKAFAQAISGSYTGVGMAVGQDKRGLLVTLTYPGSPANKGGLKARDIITEVNGKSIAGESADAAVAKIKGKEGTKVTLTVITPKTKNSKKFGPERAVVLTRKAIDIPVADGKLYNRDGRKIGVVRLLSFTETAGELVAKQVQKLKKQGATSWVLDLRGNGGGRLDQAVNVSSIFIKGGMIVATDGRARPRTVYDAVERDFITPQPLAVLVDKGSASASEITAGAIKYRDRGLIIGTRTYGKGVFQEVTELENGGALSLTVGRYELPGKRFITKAGLMPDLKVDDDPRTRPDEALDAAFESLAQFKQ